MFIGEYQHSIDLKGRLIVPSKIREQLGYRFIMTKGLDHCLFIYPLEEWAKFEEKLKALPISSKESRAFVRHFVSGAVECEIDKQGRLNIPQNLRQHANIQKEAVVVGAISRVEIWDKAEWQAYNENNNLDDEQVFGKITEIGI